MVGAITAPAEPRSTDAGGPDVSAGEVRVAVLLTTHNRVNHTVSCLESVLTQQLPLGVTIGVFMVDDGSIDGTGSTVRERFPTVEVIEGSGHLYWNGGMAMAFEQALRGRFDFYLLLNDDVELCLDALLRLLRTAQDAAPPTIVVGALLDRHARRVTYGGWIRTSRVNLLRMSQLECSSSHQACDTFNGNCVLVPRAVVEKIGGLDRVFTHAMGDFDYGLRARRAGLAVLVAAGHVGFCEANTGLESWRDKMGPSVLRWRKLLGPKGLPPREWLVFTRRHGGVLWPILWVNPYLRFWAGELRARLWGGMP